MHRSCVVVYEGIVFTIHVPDTVPLRVSARAALLYARIAYAEGVCTRESSDGLVSRCLCSAFEDVVGYSYDPSISACERS